MRVFFYSVALRYAITGRGRPRSRVVLYHGLFSLSLPPSLSLAQLSQSKWQFSMVKKLLESIERAFHIPSPVPLSRSGRGSMGSVEDKLGASTKETSLNRTGGQSVRGVRRRHPTHPSLFKMASSKTNDLQMGARCIEMTMGGLLMVWLAFCHDATFKT